MSENLTDIVARARSCFEMGDFSCVKRTLEAASFDESRPCAGNNDCLRARAEGQRMLMAIRPDSAAIGAFALTTVVMIALLLLYAL